MAKSATTPKVTAETPQPQVAEVSEQITESITNPTLERFESEEPYVQQEEDMSLSGLDITLAEEDKFENDTLITVAIKSKEGFLRTPKWDNAQWTWGYGTEATLQIGRAHV